MNFYKKIIFSFILTVSTSYVLSMESKGLQSMSLFNIGFASRSLCSIIADLYATGNNMSNFNEKSENIYNNIEDICIHTLSAILPFVMVEPKFKSELGISRTDETIIFLSWNTLTALKILRCLFHDTTKFDRQKFFRVGVHFVNLFNITLYRLCR